MRYVIAVLMLVILAPPVYAQSRDMDYLEALEWICIGGDEKACSELERIETGREKPDSPPKDARTVSITLCNRSGEAVFYALGGYAGAVAGGEYRSRGWWNIQGGECRDLWTWYAGDPGHAPRLFLVYAETDSGRIWQGDDLFLCTPKNQFDISGNHKGDCPKRGYLGINVFEGDRLEMGYTLNLNP